MYVRRYPTHVEVLAPAKINLFLEVLAKRPDGYHELETVLSAISIYDTLTFQPQAAEEIQFSCHWGHGFSARDVPFSRGFATAHELLAGAVPCGPDNLAWRAAALLRERSGTRQGAVMHLVKRIPAAAGLGGASSDAAAGLVAANSAWNLHWPLDRLQGLAAELGSDVPFFLTGGAAVCRGRGEVIDSIASCPLHFVVVRPPVGLSTKDVYQRCSPGQESCSAAAMTAAMASRQTMSVARQLKNDLQAPASQLTPSIAQLGREFSRQHVLGHQMSGSGSSCFALVRSRRQSRRIATRLRARNAGQVFGARSVSG
jgi:4-diphosphocytidyl-2-C-methyl-D-erythritol kinase